MSLRLRKTTMIRIAIDVTIILGAGITLLLVHLFVKPFNRGFFCDDQTIKHPYKEDTVPMIICAIIGSIIGVISFVAIEFSLSLGCKKTKDSHLFPVLWTTSKIMILFFFGIGCNLILTETGKLCLGRLRPNFLTVCKPNMTTIDCSQFVEDFTCTNTELSQKIIHDSRKSFPSGHSSFVAFAALFIGFYYQKRLNFEYSVLLKTFLQMVLIVLAMFTMFSRVSDYKHHWSDVMAGAVLGMADGVWIIGCLGHHIDLKMGPFRPKKAPSFGGDTVQVPLSDPCTPEPATFLAPQYDIHGNAV